MKSEKNILIAFILNLSFSVFEFFGGIFTGSAAILSDAVHDVGDAVSIGFLAFLERKSKREPNNIYTYGYVRYSVIGGFVTTLMLLVGSVAVIYNAALRIFEPVSIDCDGMILFAVIGVAVNLSAAFFTRDGHSLNQRAVNLHMLEDVFGWIAILVGAAVMRFTRFTLIDPVMSIGIALFIVVNALKNLKAVLDIFLAKTPRGIDVNEIKARLTGITGVVEVHHIHVWSMDGFRNYATMHIVTNANSRQIKEKIRKELDALGIDHVTLELESEGERCRELQ